MLRRLVIWILRGSAASLRARPGRPDTDGRSRDSRGNKRFTVCFRLRGQSSAPSRAACGSDRDGRAGGLHCSPAERLEQVVLLTRPRGPCLAAATAGPMAIAAEPLRPAAARAAAAPMEIAAERRWARCHRHNPKLDGGKEHLVTCRAMQVRILPLSLARDRFGHALGRSHRERRVARRRGHRAECC